jgi:uncharacterized protein (DUF1800 family)
VTNWLDQQFNLPIVDRPSPMNPGSLSRPWLEAYAAQLPAGTGVSQDDRVQRWFDIAVRSPDQLRQRVAWSLGQILVASDRDAFLIDEEIQMAEWSDIMVRNAFGNYRDLMREVTYSPMMGRYLTTMRNRKFELNRPGTFGCSNADPNVFCAGNNGVQPDENYAREVMQLFSIGLLVRGNDFYQTFPDGQGVLATTYAEDDISGLSRFFTGLAYDCTQGTTTVAGVALTRNCGVNNNTACTGIGCRFTAATRLFFNDPPRDAQDRGLVHPDWYRPMVCYPRYNDNGRDTSGAILENEGSGAILPPGTPTPTKSLVLGSAGGNRSLSIDPSFADGAPLNCHLTTGLNASQQQACVNYCEGSINQALDLLFNHPNTPPMVARQMIQRLVTSNPSSDYVTRVANAFINDGTGVRGDMKAVVRAILTDAEARRAVTDPATAPNFGKTREPMLKQIALWRHFGAVSGDTGLLPATNVQGGAVNPFAGLPSRRRWGNNNPQDIFQQRPYGAPTVFNFYEPDYKQPGQVTDAGLFSPELQIIHEVTAVSTANELYGRICSGYGGGGNNCSSGALTGGPNNTPPNDRSYFPTAQLDLLPAIAPVNSTNAAEPTVAQDMALINFFNVRMLGGTMSGADITTFDCAAPQAGMKWRLMSVLRCPRPLGAAPDNTGDIDSLNIELNGGTNGTTGGTRDERERRKALYLMHLIAISPEYSTQR